MSRKLWLGVALLPVLTGGCRTGPSQFSAYENQQPRVAPVVVDGAAKNSTATVAKAAASSPHEHPQIRQVAYLPDDAPSIALGAIPPAAAGDEQSPPDRQESSQRPSAKRPTPESTREGAAPREPRPLPAPAGEPGTVELEDLSTPPRGRSGDPRRASEPSRVGQPLETQPGRSAEAGRLRTAEGPLTLAEVYESVYAAFPALEALQREMDIAAGKEVAAWGEFDLKLKAESVSAPTGYYQNYRNQVKVEQGLFPGGNLFGQYRIGEGDFPTWYGERETNEGGEFKVGLITPLLRDRSIDQRRADIYQATLRRQQVDPMVRGQLLEFNYMAADAFWSWVAAGLGVEAQEDLLRVTVERNKVYEERVKAKDLAEIELVQNRRLIASREAKLIEAQRKLQQSAIKLSLFLRDENGDPVLPRNEQLPERFPEPSKPDTGMLSDAIARALNDRPELRELDVQREQADVDMAVGQNLRMPSLNAVVEASKDVGARSSSKGDKSPFEMEAGLVFDVPIQRRKAEGKIREAEAKIAQIAAKRKFTENKVVVQVQDAMSAMATAYDRLSRARDNHVLAQQLEKAERDRFEAQDSDLLRVALQESAEIEAALLVIDALADYFKAEAAFRAAIGVAE